MRQSYAFSATSSQGPSDVITIVFNKLRAEYTPYAANGTPLAKVVAECIETIHPPGEPELVMRFINILRLNDDGLIERLDIFWKTPPRMPPAWITPEAILDDAGG